MILIIGFYRISNQYIRVSGVLDSFEAINLRGDVLLLLYKPETPSALTI